MLFFSWNKSKETRQWRTAKNKEGQRKIRKQGRKKRKQTRKKERETESEKGEVKEAKEKTGRHWEMNKITRVQGKNSVLWKDKKHKILRRVEGQQPPKHIQFVFVLVPLVSSWSPIVFVYLVHCKSVTHLDSFLLSVFCFFLFLVVVFRFLFPSLSLLCSLFLILLFLFPAFSLCVTPKTRSNHRISEMFILMFCFGACILALWLGPAKNPYSAQRTTPQNGS